MERGGGSGDSLRYHRKHSATGVLLHLSRDGGGGYFGRVTKSGSLHGVGADGVGVKFLFLQ